jgi:hypothetical protein
MAYDDVRSLEHVQPWLEQVIHFPEEVVDRAWKSIPPDWIAGEVEALEARLERLFARAEGPPS